MLSFEKFIRDEQQSERLVLNVVENYEDKEM